MDNVREKTPGRVRWRSVAIPAEHGGWGMLFSPILLGLLVVPSLTGLFLILLYISAFLARTPLKIVWKDRQRERHYARTAAAMKALGIYGLLLIFSLTAAVLSGGFKPLLPLAWTLPLSVLILYYDLFSSSRKLLPELIAPIALSAVVAGMAIAAGWNWPQSLAIWTIPLMREIPAVLFVRARLRLDRDQPASVTVCIAAQSAALILAIALVRLELIPLLTAVAIFILLARAVFGLSPYRRPLPVKTIGWSEIALGLMTVMLSAIGYWMMGA